MDNIVLETASTFRTPNGLLETTFEPMTVQPRLGPMGLDDQRFSGYPITSQPTSSNGIREIMGEPSNINLSGAAGGDPMTCGICCCGCHYRRRESTGDEACCDCSNCGVGCDFSSPPHGVVCDFSSPPHYGRVQCCTEAPPDECFECCMLMLCLLILDGLCCWCSCCPRGACRADTA